MNKLVMIKASDLKKNMVFVHLGITYTALKDSFTYEGEHFAEVEILHYGHGTGLVIIDSNQLVLILGEV